MLPTRHLIALLSLVLLPATAAAQLVNGNFEAGFLDGLALGWSKFGTGRLEGRDDGNNRTQGVADVPASGQCGVYQQVSAIPGSTIRARVRTLSGNVQLFASVGVANDGGTNPSTALYSSEYNGSTGQMLQVELVAINPQVTLFLRVRNASTQSALPHYVEFDDASVEMVLPSPTPTFTATRTMTVTATPTPGADCYRSNDVFGNLADLRSLAYARAGVRQQLLSSRDPSGGNADAGHFQGQISLDGRTWDVMADLTGPGALVRAWMTGFDAGARLRIYVDHPTVPAVDCTVSSFYGACQNFRSPFAGYSTGGYYNYLPIVFTQSCRVLAEHTTPFGMYWQLNVLQFDSAAGLRPYSNPLHNEDQMKMLSAQAQANALGGDPKPPSPQAITDQGTISIPRGQTVTLWQEEGSGMVSQLWVNPQPATDDVIQNVWLQASWDEETLPSIRSPLGDFFGCNYGWRDFRALVVGMTADRWLYCFLPMPFERGARIEIRNDSAVAVLNLPYRVVHEPLLCRDDHLLRLHAAFRVQTSDSNDYCILLDTGGSGHYIGCVAGMGYAGGGGPAYGFLEGDEFMWIDGETQASLAGTGTEDYFNCGFYYRDGPATRPYHGCTFKDDITQRVSTYRFHLTDPVPFRTRFRLGFEIGGYLGSGLVGQYRSTCFYYRRHIYEAPPLEWSGGARVAGWPGVFLAGEFSSLAEFNRFRVYRSNAAGETGTLLGDQLIDPVYTDTAPPAVALAFYAFRAVSPEGFETTDPAFSLAPNVSLRNALTNADFESPSGFPNGVAFGWSGYPTSQNFSSESSVVRNGRNAQKISDWSGATRALYQSVSVAPGTDLIGGIFVRHSRANSNAVIEVGLDPTGGNNPNSTNVRYRRVENRSGWVFGNVQTTSQADRVTFFVRGRNAGDTDDWYFDDAVLVEISDPSLAAPSGLRATVQGGCVDLSWNNPSAVSFAVARIYRSTQPGTLGPRIADGITSGSFRDCSGALDTTYYYTVRAFHTTGRESANRDPVTVRTGSNESPPLLSSY